MALPSEAHQPGNINGLSDGLGKSAPIDLQSVSAARPKPSFPIVITEWERNSREIVRVALDQYNGAFTINVRVWYRDGDEFKPGRSGLTLALKHLPKLASGLANALSRAEAMGMISTD
jgi:hypothetical protein